MVPLNGVSVGIVQAHKMFESYVPVGRGQVHCSIAQV